MKIKSLILLLVVFALGSCESNLEKSNKYFDLGMDNFKYREYDLAIENFEKALDYDSEHFEAQFFIGNCFMNTRDYENAIDAFFKAIEIHPKYADAYANIGHAYGYLRNMPKACENYRKAQELGKPNLEDKLRHCN
jgi:superkiller protein 3